MLAQGLGPFEIVVVVLYLLVIGYLGWLGWRRTKTAADYMIAGRKVHPFIMALSYGATFISTSAIVGFGGVAGLFGMSLLWLTFLNIFVGIFIAFVFLGGPTRNMGHRLDAHTFPELIGRRFQSKFLQIFAGLVIFLFIPLYAAAVLIGGCEFIDTKFNIGYDVALFVFSAIIALYVIMGGLKGVMYTDALQGSIMFVGMIALLVGSYAMLGGVNTAHRELGEMADQAFGGFQLMGHRGWTATPEFGWGAKSNELWWIVFSTIVLGVGIGVLAQPQLAVRFMTVKSKRELNRAVLVGGVFILIMTGVAFTVGSLSNLYFSKHEVVEGRLTGVTENAPVIAKKERGIGKGGKDVVPIPCTLLHIDSTGDGDADTHLVYSSPVPAKLNIPSAQIENLAGREPEELIKTAVTVRPRATAFTRAVVQKGVEPTTGDPIYAFNPDSIIPTYITSAMPAWFGLLFLLTLLAAAMSTLSSQFHALGTSIGRDVYEQISSTKSGGVGVTRMGIVLGIVVAVVISHYARGGYIIARATAIFFGLCASAFLPAFLGGLFWKRATRAGAIISMVAGFLVTAFWLVFIKDKEARALGICHALTEKYSLLLPGKEYSSSWHVVDPVVIALPISLVVLVVVSLLTKPPAREHLERCFGKKS
jgi:SSS family solute:Na+ symporter